MRKEGKQCQTLFWGGFKITADGNCSHEIKIRFLLGRTVMTNLDSILKSRDITLSTKVHLVKAMVFQWSRMDVRVGLWRKLSTEELMLLNCGVGEDSWGSLGLQGEIGRAHVWTPVTDVHLVCRLLLVLMWELDHDKRLSTKERLLLNCGVGEDSWESLGLQGDQTSQT